MRRVKYMKKRLEKERLEIIVIKWLKLLFVEE